MAKQETLAQYLGKVTNPQNWKKEFKNQVLELLESLAELYMIDKALETLIGNGKKLNDFQDPEIRERMKVIIAGGLTPNKQSQNTNKKPLAPIIWELFNIELHPHRGDSLLNYKDREDSTEYNYEDLIEYLKIHGIENITIHKGTKGRLSEWYSLFCRAVDPLIEFLEIIGEVPSRDPVKTFINGMHGASHRTDMDRNLAKEIIKKYIPSPAQRATELEKLLNNIMKAFWNLAPGINPYITFALSVDVVMAHDLLDLVNGNQADFIDLVRILDFKALEDRRSNGDISCRDIPETLKSILSKGHQNLYNVLLYAVWSEPRYGRPEYVDHSLSWVHNFCCYTYGVGCVKVYKGFSAGVACKFEELVYGSALLRDHICTYMLSEVRRILQRTANPKNTLIGNVIGAIHGAILGGVASLSKGSSGNLRGYNRYWNEICGIRNAGALYSPAFTVQLYTYPHKHGDRLIHVSTEKYLRLNIPQHCSIADKVKDLIRAHSKGDTFLRCDPDEW